MKYVANVIFLVMCLLPAVILLANMITWTYGMPFLTFDEGARFVISFVIGFFVAGSMLEAS